MSDHEVAARLATAAGRLLLDVREEFAEADAKERKAAGDKRSHDFLMEALAAARPADAVLSEEGIDDPVRLSAERVWIVDPLDGTREFGEGRHDWAVHVGLSIAGRATVGAVALPGRGMTLATDAPPPLQPLRNPPRMLVSRTRASTLCSDVSGRIGAEMVGMGSAGAKAMAVVLGEAEIYLHSGGQYQWDNCAPAAVAAAAGLHVSRIDGSPIVYNGAERAIPDLLICRKEWAGRVLAAVQDCG